MHRGMQLISTLTASGPAGLVHRAVHPISRTDNKKLQTDVHIEHTARPGIKRQSQPPACTWGCTAHKGRLLPTASSDSCLHLAL